MICNSLGRRGSSTAFSRAKSVDDVVEIRDKAEAIRRYAIQREDKEMEQWISEIKLRATRRIGELSRELEKATPDKGHGAGLPTGGKTKNEALKAAGLSTSSAHRCEQVAAIAPAIFEAYVTEKVSAGKPVKAAELIAATQPVKPAVADTAPAAKPKDADHDNRLAEAIKMNDETQAENRELQARIDALTVTDLAKKVDELVRANAHAVREKDMEMDKNAILLKRANDAERFRSEVVKISGSQNPKAAIQWVKSMAATQRQSA